jgi:arylsulfatase B
MTPPSFFFGRAAALLVMALTAFIRAEGATSAPRAPNVLIILADDLGRSDVGFAGSTEIKTPNLDKFAASGVRLDRFYACPVCSPTRAGLLTGRWPLRFGLMKAVIPPWSDFGLPETERLMPELLASAGYERRGMVGKWHLGHSRQAFLPPQRGFTSFYGHYNGAIDSFTHEREGETDWHDGAKTVKEEGYSTDILAREAVRFIEASPEGKPWFLYAAFNAPHDPLAAKPEDIARYAHLPVRRRTYAAMVDSLDQAVGRILATIERRSDAADTLVLFMSDNGGVLAHARNAPLRDGKFSVYEGGVRVCAALRWPAAGLAGGQVSAAPLGYIDVLPTLLRAAGAPAPGGAQALDGIDLVPVLRGDAAAVARVNQRPWYSYYAQGGRPPGAAVMVGDWKLVAMKGDVLRPGRDPKTVLELYDLRKDSAEEHDLAKAQPERVKELSRLLNDFGALETAGVGEFAEGRQGFKAPKDWIITR